MFFERQALTGLAVVEQHELLLGGVFHGVTPTSGWCARR